MATKKVYDDCCPWPYHMPYGLVKAPKAPRVKRPRKVQVTKSWQKLQRTHAHGHNAIDHGVLLEVTE